MNDNATQWPNGRHYDTVKRALRYLAEHQARQPGLNELADAIGLSPHHLHRTFQQWAGITPKQFLQHLTRQAALTRLHAGQSVLNASLDAGLSGPGRLHDLLIKTDAVTPGEFRRGGLDLMIRHGCSTSPFGPVNLAWTDRGLNFLGFPQDGDAPHETRLREQWPMARLQRDQRNATRWSERIFGAAEKTPLPVWLHGSPFQLQVWQALLSIPPGTAVAYRDLAQYIGRPGAARAVGKAVGANPIAWLIPCHRVIQSVGGLGGYRWGLATKQAMLGVESLRSQTA